MRTKKIIITLVMALVAIMAFIIITMLTSKKYDLSNYVTINEYGYDGAGTIDVQIDSKRYLKDCHSENQLTDKVLNLSLSQKVSKVRQNLNFFL